MTEASIGTDSLAGGGAFVGPYRLERALGRGGMGLVFLAHRADQQYEKRVAIKLLSGVLRDQTLLRFRAERQILAKLDHPHIARMLDGGVTQAGEPYFVMDYVPGAEPIDDYCDHHKLSIRSRIELFLDVCDAVHYAHRFLVVHRDLKPSNVQVSRDGVAKLVDFGIAKDLLSTIEDEAHVPSVPVAEGNDNGSLTGRTMTPGYASPEQVRGEAIGTASDIYALGVLLYELLTGTTPYLSSSTDLESLLREVSEGAFVRPSQCYARRGKPAPEHVLNVRGLTNTRQLERLLTGDLDAIIRKAMTNSAQARYASADQLSEDLRRYLSGDLVMASQHSTAYRLSKVYAKNRAISSALATVLFSTLFVASAMASLALKNYLDLLDARIETGRSQEVAHYLTEIFKNAGPNAPAADVLRKAATGLGGHVKGEADWREPARLAVGEALVGAGAPADAAPLLEQVVLENEKTYDHANPDRVIAMAFLGDALLGQGKAREAAAWYRRAIDARGQLDEIPRSVPAKSEIESHLAEALREAAHK